MSPDRGEFCESGPASYNRSRACQLSGQLGEYLLSIVGPAFGAIHEPAEDDSSLSRSLMLFTEPEAGDRSSFVIPGTGFRDRHRTVAGQRLKSSVIAFRPA